MMWVTYRLPCPNFSTIRNKKMNTTSKSFHERAKESDKYVGDIVKGEKTKVVLRESYTGSSMPALVVYDGMTGEPYATATVNLPGEPLLQRQVFIKNWSENAGILEALIDASIVEDTGTTVATGFVHAHVCNLLKGIK